MNVIIRSSAGLVAKAVPAVSPSYAIDRKFFGPVYHGTDPNRMEKALQEGFKIFVDNARSGDVTNGYPDSPYWDGKPAPIHHLGYGIYFTTVLAIAKQFNHGTTKGLKTFYLDVPRLEVINFGAPRTMMKWWEGNGYDFAKTGDRIKSTVNMTDSLKAKYDAVWYKGKGLHRLLDGDQICVYDPERIYMVDKSLASGWEVGSKVVRLSDGMVGVIVKVEKSADILERFPAAATWLKGSNYRMTVKWNKGGTDYNVLDTQVRLRDENK